MDGRDLARAHVASRSGLIMCLHRGRLALFYISLQNEKQAVVWMTQNLKEQVRY